MRPFRVLPALLLAACTSSTGDAWLVDAAVQAPTSSDALRTRTAEVQRSFVPHANTPLAFDTGGSVDIELFPDLAIEATLDRLSVNAQSTTWIGHVIGWPDREVVLTRTRDGFVAGTVRLPTGVVRITPIGTDQVRVDELADTSAGVDLEPLVPSFLPPGAVPAGDSDEDSAPRVQVLVAATAPAATAMGGESGLKAVAANLIAQANEGYEDSDVGMRLELAGVHVSGWDEDGFDWTDALVSAANTSDGVMDDVAVARADTGADIVSVLVAGDSNACGLGYLMSPARADFAPAAYNVVNQLCAGSNLSFAHEVGHNLGLHHDRDNASGTPATSYAYGYQVPDAGYRTVMAYSCDGASCPRVNLWSTPDVEVDGQAAGRPVDASDSAHNVAAMGLTAPIAEDFGTAVDVEEPVASQILLPEDRTVLGGSTLALTWQDVGADDYVVTVGSSAGGADVDRVDAGTDVSATLTGLPTDGSTLYVTLWSEIDGEFYSDSHTYTAADPIPRAASILTPEDGHTFTSASAAFTWTDAKADSYALVLGSTADGSDLGTWGTSSTRFDVSGLPTDGRTIYATLYSRDGETWRSDSRQYTAFKGESVEAHPATLIEPAPGSTLIGRVIRLSWTDTGASNYDVTITQNGAELVHATTNGTAVLLSLPPSTQAGRIEVRLASELESGWFSRSSTFTIE
ncbi:MAG: M12 family metallo-peptidase [Myxococcota bacterium]